MMNSSNKRLLREYIRQINKEHKSLNEDYGGDYGGVSGYGIGYDTGGGGHSKASKGSTSAVNVYGSTLTSIFIQPFVDAIKVIGAEILKTGVNFGAVLATVLEGILGALVPKFKVNYDGIVKTRQKAIGKIKEKYKSSYRAVQESWEHPDIQMFAFMHDPTTWLSYRAITAKPDAAMSVFDALVEGNNTLSLYMRDIRNRMYGATVPGVGTGGTNRPMPVHAEGRQLIRELISTTNKQSKPKPKTPGEIVADALTDPKFLAQLKQLPVVQQMQKDAAAIENQSTSELKNAMNPILNANSVQDLATASHGSWQIPNDVKQLDNEQKEIADEEVVKQTKASMATYYETQLSGLLKQLDEMGVSPESPYARSLRAMIDQLAPYKQPS